LARIETDVPFAPVPVVAGVELKNGTVIRGAVRIDSEGRVTAASSRLGDLTFAPHNLAAIFLDWRGEDSRPGSTGVLFANGDFLRAEATGLSASSVSVSSLAGDLEVPLERVAALRLGPAAQRDGAAAQLLLDNGDILNGDLQNIERDSIGISAPEGVLEVPRRFVASVDFPQRRGYLSDLAVAFSAKGFAPEGPVYWQIDGSPDGALQAGGLIFRKGFFTRAGAVVTVPLPAASRAVVFYPALAERSNPPVGIFRATAAGKVLWQKTVRPETPLAAVAVPVKGLASVELEFQSEPPGLIGAAGLWGDAFVTVEDGR
jgi:hypothetical protein